MGLPAGAGQRRRTIFAALRSDNGVLTEPQPVSLLPGSDPGLRVNLGAAELLPAQFSGAFMFAAGALVSATSAGSGGRTRLSDYAS
jgi:hypothetical protein